MSEKSSSRVITTTSIGRVLITMKEPLTTEEVWEEVRKTSSWLFDCETIGEILERFRGKPIPGWGTLRKTLADRWEVIDRPQKKRD